MVVGEHGYSAVQRYDLSHLPPGAKLKQLVSLIKACRICEQAHQQLREELGLNHFKALVVGLHRHAR
jgi:hypothetical protein